MQTKRRKTIRWYLVEGGGIQHFQIKLKFWHYATNKFDLQAYRRKHMKLFIDIVMKRIYLFNFVAWNYSKEIGFPVCKKENFVGLQAHRKRGKSARASPTPHHTLNEERSARFTAQHLSALLRTADAFPVVASLPKNALKKAVKNRVQYHGERCNRGQFIALWNTTF